MISTGIIGLDEILTGLRLGDNVVWQIDDIDDYIELVTPFVSQARKENKNLIYIRFASHKKLIPETTGIKVYELDAYAGFETFASSINSIITKEGRGAYYVFDCLSELLSAWATDLMIGNFFMVTCPYLFELDTIAYFSILRNNHSYKSIARIRETTQLLLEVYHFEASLYIHPLKVWNRYSPTMFLPHQREKDKFIPITDSVDAVKLLSYIKNKGLEETQRNLDYWDRMFLDAERLSKEKVSEPDKKDLIKKLCAVMITKNEKILNLAAGNFSLDELLDIKSRLIGTGFIGGKTVGMLLARKILSKEKSLDWDNLSESHDSFYIGSDIFYSYIVENNLWNLRMQQKTQEGYFKIADIIRERILYGKFPEVIMEYFQQIIEYFGNSPIIIRSSSLLEDSFGNAFAGKYESVFLANQGTPEQRYIQFSEAVRKVYASTMGEDALAYRKQRGLDKFDEQMALLVQRVSGSEHTQYFFPDLAGVGISYNTYVWSQDINPHDGILRLVFGLGTRAVNRVEGDYPRMVALNEPAKRPYAEKDDLRKFSQHDVDLINTKENILETVSFSKIANENLYKNIDSVAIKDLESMQKMSDIGLEGKEYWILTLDKVLKNEKFVNAFKHILKSLEKNYNYPVEIEFTVNFTDGCNFKINLLQCRPLQTRGLGQKVVMPKDVKAKDLLFESKGYFLGGNISQQIKTIIYVNPQKYSEVPLSQKYEVARIVGRLNREIKNREESQTLLLGPGRWGTTTPSLGVPVKFAEINNVSFLVELAYTLGNVMPELSFGTHFFHDLVESNIFYVAVFPDNKDNVVNEKWLSAHNDIFLNLMPDFSKYTDIICVYDVRDMVVKIISDVVMQKVICFVS